MFTSSRLSSTGTNICRHFFRNGTAKRTYASQTQDLVYLQKGLQKSEYRQRFKNNTPALKVFPNLMDRYFKVTAAMQAKNIVPFVHAQASPYRGVRIFAETLCRSFHKDVFFRYLRQPSGKYNINKGELMQKVDAHVKEHGDLAFTPGDFCNRFSRLDQDPSVRDHLISGNYSMMEFAYMESVYHFLFNNSNASGLSTMLDRSYDIVSRLLKTRGLQHRRADVWKHLESFFHDYAKLPIGTLFVIGIPQAKLEEYVYDSKSFGVPSGQSATKIVNDLSNTPRSHTDEEGGLQARLMIHKETLNPQSGIVVIDVNDPEEVERFCHGVSIKDHTKEEVFAPIFKDGPTLIEKDHQEKQLELDRKVRLLALGEIS